MVLGCQVIQRCLERIQLMYFAYDAMSIFDGYMYLMYYEPRMSSLCHESFLVSHWRCPTISDDVARARHSAWLMWRIC